MKREDGLKKKNLTTFLSKVKIDKDFLDTLHRENVYKLTIF